MKSFLILNKSQIYITSLIILFLILLPSLIYSQEASIKKLDFNFQYNGIKISVNLKNTLPEKSPEIIGERIRYIDMGREVNIIYYITLWKKAWFLFVPYNESVLINNKKEIIITRTLKKDIVTKIYTITETSNFFGIIGLEEESTFSGSIFEKPSFKKEKNKKLREVFFEKELNFKINYKFFKLRNNSEYFITCKAEYKSFNPMIGLGEPNNFYTKEKSSEVKKYYND